MSYNFGFWILDWRSPPKPKYLTEQTIDVFIGYFREGGVCSQTKCGFANGLVKDRGHFVTSPLCPDLNKSDRRPLIKNDHQQAPADDADKNAFTLTFMNDRRERILADELRHARRGGDITGRE